MVDCFRFLPIVLASVLALDSSVAAQSKWEGYYPPPVRVAAFGKDSQPEVGKRSDVGRAAYEEPLPAVIQEPLREPLRPIPSYPGWTEMPPDLRAALPSEGESLGNSLGGVSAPPHLVIQAPRQQKQSLPRNRLPSAVPQTANPQEGVSRGMQEEVSQGMSVHPPAAFGADRSVPRHHPHLPEFPGVENDPNAAGPGHLGAGTQWLKTQPGPRQMIPNATVQPTWKAPYSYGYFGSPGKRHWTRQSGYRDRHLQWTLR